VYGCETWSFTLRGEHKLRVFDKRVLSKIFGPKRDEATGQWRRLHNEDLYNFCSSPSITRMIKSGRIRWTGHVERMGNTRGAYRGLVARPDGKRQFGRYRCKWEENIKMTP